MLAKLNSFGIGAAALALIAAPAGAAPVTFSGAASSVAGLTPTVDAFRAAAGGDDSGNAPINQTADKRRQIDWDAAPDSVSDPNAFPGDFFNFPAAPRARGIEFSETGNTTGFLLSGTAAAEAGGGAPINFGMSSDFQPFSPERLFTPIGGTTFDILFFDPVDAATPATSRGLGLVFVDVEEPDVTTVTYFDQDDNVLASLAAEVAGNAGFSFVGVLFDDPTVFRVSVNAGDAAILGNGSVGQGTDAVVVDDVIFGEPVPAANAVPAPAGGILLLSGLIAFFGTARLRRCRTERRSG